jgi:hypothetical protein
MSWRDALAFVHVVLPPATARHAVRVGKAARAEGDWDLAYAALLHDVLEDGIFPSTGERVTVEDVRVRWGVTVARLVLDVSDVFTPERCPGVSRRYRKALEAVRLARVCDRAWRVKELDIADNQGRTDGEKSPSFLAVWGAEKALTHELRATFGGEPGQAPEEIDQLLGRLLRGTDAARRPLWEGAQRAYTEGGGWRALDERVKLRRTLEET